MPETKGLPTAELVPETKGLPLNIESAVISEEEIADDTAVCLVCFYLKSSQVE